MRIEVPPLRQRREDIRELSRFYLEQAANELGVAPKTLSADADRSAAGATTGPATCASSSTSAAG